MDVSSDSDKTEFSSLMTFPTSVGSALIKPEDQGKIKGNAMAAMREQTQRQLNQLYSQMQVLVDQAGLLKKRVEISETIYQASIPFQPVVGHRYYLYQRPNGTNFLSMISPEEWGKSEVREQFKAAITLLSDHTWEVHN